MFVVFILIAGVMGVAAVHSTSRAGRLSWFLVGVVVLFLVALSVIGLTTRTVTDVDGMTIVRLRREHIPWTDVAELRVQPTSRTSFDSQLDTYRLIVITHGGRVHVITSVQGTHAQVMQSVADMLDATPVAVPVNDRPGPPPSLRDVLAAQRRTRRHGRAGGNHG